MKSIIFCGLILALVMSCRAGGKEDWKAMHDKMCDVGISADNVNALIQCSKAEHGETGNEMGEKMFKECGANGADDAKTFTNLTTDDQKTWVIFHCSKAFHDCLREKRKEEGPKGKGPKEMSEEENEKMKAHHDKFMESHKKVIDCQKKVLGL